MSKKDNLYGAPEKDLPDADSDFETYKQNYKNLEKTKVYHTVSKWQRASVKLTQLKIDLENLLETSFDEHDRKDDRYDLLVENLEFIFKHILEQYGNKKESSTDKIEKRNKRRSILNWVNLKNSLFALGVAAITAITTNIDVIIRFIGFIFKGTP